MAAKWGKKNKEIVGGASAPVAEPERISNKLEHVLVAESKVSSSQQAKLRAKSLWGRAKNHRRFKPALIVFLVITIVAVTLVVLARPEKPTPVAKDGPKCTYQTLEKAKPNLSYKKIQKLQPSVAEIEGIQGYDTDPNCLGVVTTYYVLIGDSAKARQAYDKLQAVYDPTEGYATVLAGAVNKPEVLKTRVELLEQQAKLYQQDSKGPFSGENKIKR